MGASCPAAVDAGITAVAAMAAIPIRIVFMITPSTSGRPQPSGGIRPVNVSEHEREHQREAFDATTRVSSQDRSEVRAFVGGRVGDTLEAHVAAHLGERVPLSLLHPRLDLAAN